MRTLKYAILGLLNREDLTGYDIAKEFSKALGNFWTANHSQIYPELAKLTSEGLVCFSLIIQKEKLEKKLYTITKQGREDFALWLRNDEPLEPSPKDIFKLKTYFLDSLTHEEKLAQFYSQQKKRLNKFQNLVEHQALKFPNGSDNLTDSQLGDYLVLNGAISRESAYLDWITQCIHLLKKRPVDVN